MKIMKNYFLRIACFLFLFAGCAKFDLSTRNQQLLLHKKSQTGLLTLASDPYCYACGIIDNMPPVDYDGDSIARPTILGMQHVNPYLVPNMQQAYANLGITNVPVTVTNLYVRFLPASVEQLAVLDSAMDSRGLDLFDAPMDYDILQEGEYYQDPVIPDSMVTYQYAVVPPGFQFPAGINYTILAQIHIPEDAYTAVETEAERLAAIQDSLNATGKVYAVKPNSEPPGGCPPGYKWNPATRTCEPESPPPPQPPPPAPDASIAVGYITVSDINLNTIPGVRNVRIVVKRWFKIERLSTDNIGHFQSSKHFKNKAKVVVKFTNGYCNIRGIRGIRIWNLVLPVEKTMGVYSSNKNNITANFDKYNTNMGAKGNLYWVAATTHNAIQEHRDYASQYGFSPAPMGLNIYLTNWGIMDGLSSTPLFGKRFISDIPNSFVTTFLTGTIFSIVTPVTGIIAGITRARLDMAIGYHQGNINKLTSDGIKETIYHEASHGSQYTQMGSGWYLSFVNAELSEIIQHPSGKYNPYGDGASIYSPIIALGEAWGYHMGQFLADKQYGMSSHCAGEQFACYPNNYISGLSSHLVALENFDPYLTDYPFKWIPKGLFYDLMDTRNDALAIPRYVNIDDQVSGYTIQQIFGAYQSDINTLQQYKSRLLQQNNNNQSSQVLSLFQQYGY